MARYVQVGKKKASKEGPRLEIAKRNKRKKECVLIVSVLAVRPVVFVPERHFVRGEASGATVLDGWCRACSEARSRSWLSVPSLPYLVRG